MANKEEKRVIYIDPADKLQYAFDVPEARNRLGAVTIFVNALEEAGRNPKEYKIIKVEGFAPSKTERVIKKHIDRFGGE